MTATTEPRPKTTKRLPADGAEFEALVEALIEEARLRARRRRRRNLLVVLSAVAVGVAVWSIGGRAIGSSAPETVKPQTPVAVGSTRALPVPLSYSFGDQVYVVSRLGVARQLTHDSEGLFAVGWSRDGKSLVAYRWGTTTSGLVALGRDGRIQETIAARTAANPALSPDGTRVAFMHSRRGPGTGATLFVRALGGGPTQVAATGVFPVGDGGGFSWSPDGRLVYVGLKRDGLYITNPNRPTSDPIKISIPKLDQSNKLSRWFLSGPPTWSPDGRWIAFSTGRTIYLVRPDGTGLRSLGKGILPAWSPDATHLAFVGVNPDYLNWVVRPDGSDRHGFPGCDCNTSRGPGFWPYLDWSPDGTRIAFVSHKGNSISTIAPDGTHPVDVLTLKRQKYTGPTKPIWQPEAQ